MRDPKFGQLADFPLFQGVAATALPRRPLRRFPAGSLICERDDPAREVYFLRKGRVVAVYLAASGREVIFSDIPEGSHFGEISALDGGPRSLTVYAQTATEVFVLTAPEFRQLIATEALVRDRVLQHLTGMVRRLTLRAYQGAHFTVEQRLRSWLVALALQQGAFRPGGVLADAPSHAEIGAMLGANREAVSRAMSDLAKAGVLLGGRRRITLLSPDLLLAGLDPVTPG